MNSKIDNEAVQKLFNEIKSGPCGWCTLDYLMQISEIGKLETIKVALLLINENLLFEETGEYEDETLPGPENLITLKDFIDYMDYFAGGYQGYWGV